MSFNFQEPPTKTPVDNEDAISPEWVKWFIKLHTIVNTTVQCGTTAQRPSIKYTGQTYFDTTIDKPIWVNAAGTGWVDATGSSV